MAGMKTRLKKGDKVRVVAASIAASKAKFSASSAKLVACTWRT